MDYDLINEMNDLCNKLSVAGKQLRKYGLAKAEAERDYKVCLREAALRLRETKDMPVTLIDKVVYGEDEVAKKRFERDVAETMHQTAFEAINIIKLKIRILDAQISREWQGNVK
jgi:hypothetical protein